MHDMIMHILMLAGNVFEYFIALFFIGLLACMLFIGGAILLAKITAPRRKRYMAERRREMLRVKNERLARDRHNVKYLRPYVGRDLK